MTCKCKNNMELIGTITQDNNNPDSIFRIYRCTCGYNAITETEFVDGIDEGEEAVIDWHEPLERHCECTEWNINDAGIIYKMENAHVRFALPENTVFCPFCGGKIKKKVEEVD